ncbi:hypothetical protein DVH05_000960 [Phytophthora capsici]|nr:hypothetical protein DVH05_000960 [Phytophthora capsici]
MKHTIRSVRTTDKRKKPDDYILQEHSRVIHVRHHKPQATLLIRLEEDIAKLQRDVQNLVKWRQSTCINTPTISDPWLAVVEYCRFFQVGFKTSPPGLYAFLDKIMASDVTDGPICGVDALVKNWKLLSLCFKDISVQLERLDRAGDDLLVASTRTSITIGSETLRRVFPNLLGLDDNLIVAKLQGQRIVMHSSVRFDWDSSSKCIVRMLTQSDMLTPIVHLVGNLQDASRVFDGAFVTPEFRLRHCM